jgi:anti-anti-sigma factor
MSELNVQISDVSDKAAEIIIFEGEMDEDSIENFKKTIDGSLNDVNIKNLIFDLSGLEFINSKGIGYLVSVYTHLSKDHRQLIITSAKEVVMDVISLVGLTSIIKYYDTTEEALASL